MFHPVNLGVLSLTARKLGQNIIPVMLCTTLQENCQTAVTLSLANHHASLPVAYRLYLPEDWAADSKSRRQAGVPKEIYFKTKPEIALEQIEAACEADLPRGVVLMDAGYGNKTALRANVSELGLTYVAGIQSTTAVWAPGTGPLPPKKRSGRGKPPKRLRRNRKHQPDLSQRVGSQLDQERLAGDRMSRG